MKLKVFFILTVLILLIPSFLFAQVTPSKLKGCWALKSIRGLQVDGTGQADLTFRNTIVCFLENGTYTGSTIIANIISPLGEGIYSIGDDGKTIYPKRNQTDGAKDESAEVLMLDSQNLVCKVGADTAYFVRSSIEPGQAFIPLEDEEETELDPVAKPDTQRVENSITITVLSAATQTALPYTTIHNISKRKMYSTSDSGIINLNAATGDSIEVSYVGFRPQVFRYQGINQRISLLPHLHTLQPVIVSKCRKMDTYKTGYPGKATAVWDSVKRISIIWAGLGWHYEHAVNGIAFLVKPEKSASRLHKFTFWLKSFHNAPDSCERAPFMISFFESLDSTGHAASTPMCDPLIYFPKKKGRQNLNLDSLSLIIPENGIFITLNYIIDPKYAYSYHTKYRPNGWDTEPVIDTVIHDYGLTIEGNSVDGNRYYYFSAAKQKWIESKKHGLRYEAVLKYCRD